MEILEAYDLTGSLRGAAALAGCDHKTVARLASRSPRARQRRRRDPVDPMACAVRKRAIEMRVKRQFANSDRALPGVIASIIGRPLDP